MRKVVVLFAVAALLASASEAAATTDAARVARFTPIARAAWPASPCAGREVVELVAGLPGFAGMAWAAECRVEIVYGLSDVELCTVLVHEFGHLAGHPHSADPGDVMFTAPPYYGPCVAATSAPETAADLLHDMLPPPTLAWRLTWGPRFGPARRYQRVRAARGGCRVRWFIVTRAADGVSVAAWD